jgi:magnesium transporter
MTEYLDVLDGRLARLDSPAAAPLIRLVAPTPEQVQRIAELCGAPADFLLAACDRDERPRMESEDGTHLIVLRIPFEEPGADVPVITVAFGLIFTPTHVVSVCSVPSTLWESLQYGRARIPKTTDRMAFLGALLMAISRMYLTHLQNIRVEADTVERQIHHSMRNEMLIRMLNLEKCLVYFTTSLRGHENLWMRIKRIKTLPLTEEEEDQLEDIRIEFKQALDLAEIHSNILTGMMDAFASVISNNLNVVMKFLTASTIILMLPNLVASIYGMNIRLPFQDDPHAFFITMGASIVIALAGTALFLFKKFF